MFPQRIISTGFVSADGGSIASANALILNELLARRYHVTFVSKSSFVDPRPVLDKNHLAHFNYVDYSNHITDSLFRNIGSKQRGILRQAFGYLDASTYNRGIVREIARLKGDVNLWLGDWARGRSDRPTVSFVQGAPGTDARSIFKHRELIQRLAGRARWIKLAMYAWWRLGPGMKPMKYSQHVIVGSNWSRRTLIDVYGRDPLHTHAVPYPMDFTLFKLIPESRSTQGRLRLFWLGRFVPRKRLDLFLDGLAEAIRNGCDAEAWIVGQSWDWFVPNFERLIDKFPFPDRIRHWPAIPREKVTEMLSQVDAIVQPSEEEDFGSSAAEALCCGVPSIMGATNGTADYMCERSIRMSSYEISEMCESIIKMGIAKRQGLLLDRRPSRQAAERAFSVQRAVDDIEKILSLATNT